MTGSILALAEHEALGPTQAALPAIDVRHLRRYTMGDRALEAEILNLFVAEMPRVILDLRQTNDDQTWRRAAHSLKGAARALGAWELSELAERAEAMTFVDMQLDDRRGLLVAAMDGALARVEAFVKDF